MADPTEDAARSVVDPSTSRVRCPLLVIPSMTVGGADRVPESVPPPADPDAGPDLSAASDPSAVPAAAVVDRPGSEVAAGPDGPSRPVEASSAVAPGAAVDPTIPSTANRCAASVPPAVVSLGQQRLVCFDQGHVDCPRFVRAMGSPRGASGRSGRPLATVPVAVATVQAVASTQTGPTVDATGTALPGSVEPDASPIVPVTPVVRSTRRSGARRAGSRPRPIVVASGILVAALIVAFAFTSLRGGLALPSVGASAGAGVSPSPLGSTAAVSPVVSPSTEPSVTVSPSPSPSATPSPSPSGSASPSPTSTPTPSPAASVPPAYAGLKPCPDAPDCYIYRIHPGDNLTAIAKRFGITVIALKAANPEIKDPSLLHVGDKIRVPLPIA